MKKLLLFFSMATIALGIDAKPPIDFNPNWRAYKEGIELFSYKDSRPFAIYGARVDLSNENIEIVFTPKGKVQDYEMDGMRTTKFFNENNLVLAINGSPFSPHRIFDGTGQNILGYYKVNSEVVSDNRTNYTSFVIKENGKPYFYRNPQNKKGVVNSMVGYFPVMWNGKVRGSHKKREPRTIVGLSKNKRYLYLVAIDGRDETHSIGANFYEAGQWMKKIGAYEAVTMDGGGSTTFVTENAFGRARILNKPITGSILPERVVANHIGIRIKK